MSRAAPVGAVGVHAMSGGLPRLMVRQGRPSVPVQPVAGASTGVPPVSTISVPVSVPASVVAVGPHAPIDNTQLNAKSFLFMFLSSRVTEARECSEPGTAWFRHTSGYARLIPQSATAAPRMPHPVARRLGSARAEPSLLALDGDQKQAVVRLFSQLAGLVVA